jgi:hypothetical protein
MNHRYRNVKVAEPANRAVVSKAEDPFFFVQEDMSKADALTPIFEHK